MSAGGVAVPTMAVWAARLWLASAVLFGVSAVWFLWIGIGSGSAFGIGLGVISIAIAAAVYILGRRAATPDARWRSTVSVLTLVVTMAGMLVAVLFFDPFLLVSGLVGLVGSMMAYRPAAEKWFTGGAIGG
ncbi:hypothetical protein ACQ7HM_02085 [Williamsia sp. MIQD14]|uniref:hypothetical protein n=1 Tax=Williamsia sp. MIQD14 TaxID=3425703 RepID=UPI003DA0B2E9